MFIVNRVNDKDTLTKGQIIKKAVINLVCLLGIAIVLRVVCMIVYQYLGINPLKVTSFRGDPINYIGRFNFRMVLMFFLIAPICEEIVFRLAINLRKNTVALWFALTPVVTALYMLKVRTWYLLLALVVVGALFFWLIYHYSSEEWWTIIRNKWQVSVAWISAVGFGLIHLCAFSVLSWQIMPWVICTILMPFSVGCVIVYLRNNISFLAGLIMHICFNIPAIIFMMVEAF